MVDLYQIGQLIKKLGKDEQQQRQLTQQFSIEIHYQLVDNIAMDGTLLEEDNPDLDNYLKAIAAKDPQTAMTSLQKAIEVSGRLQMVFEFVIKNQFAKFTAEKLDKLDPQAQEEWFKAYFSSEVENQAYLTLAQIAELPEQERSLMIHQLATSLAG